MSERLAPYQLTQEEAIEFAERKRWEPLSPAERALLQLRQTRLCMPFTLVHEGMEALLGRGVWTHEFADSDSLWEEYQSGKTISFADVLAKLPDASRAIVVGVVPA